MIRPNLCFLARFSNSVRTHAAYNPRKLDLAGVGPSRSTCFIHLSQEGFRLFCLPSFFYRPHRRRDTSLFFAVHEQTFRVLDFFHSFLSRLSQIVVPTAIVLMCVLTNFSRVVPRDLEFRPHDLGRRGRGGRIQMTGHSDPAIPILPLARLSSSPECKPTLHQLLVLRILEVLKSISGTLPAVICDAEDPCSVNTAVEPVSSFTTSPRSATRAWYVCNVVSYSDLLTWHKSISVAE